MLNVAGFEPDMVNQLRKDLPEVFLRIFMASYVGGAGLWPAEGYAHFSCRQASGNYHGRHPGSREQGFQRHC